MKKEKIYKNIEIPLTKKNIVKFNEMYRIPKEVEEQINRVYPFIIYQEEDTNYFILRWPAIPMAYCQGESIQEVIDLQEYVKRDFLHEYYHIHKSLPSNKPISSESEMHENIKWFLQRAKKGYSDYDLHDLTEYALIFLINALRELKTKEDFSKNPENIDEILKGLTLQLKYYNGFSEIDLNIIKKSWELFAKRLKYFWY